jgi:hypothetical protein
VKARRKRVIQLAAAGVGVLLGIGIAAPYVTVDQYAKRLQGSIERALGRRVELSGVHFSLFKGPGFAVDNVTIYEDPSIGNEPIVYIQKADGSGMEIAPSVWSLLGGRFVISSIRLEGASINLAKSGPAQDWGRWNFASFIKPSLMSATPAIHIRDSRIHFKFGDVKSVFYLTETDLDISPPGSVGRAWSVECEAKPARTDRTAQGLGQFRLKGRWFVDPARVDMDLVLDRTGLGELTALMSGQAGSVHGSISARLHFGGPIQNVGIQGRLNIEDVHRWDLLPPKGKGWPLDVRGRWDLMAQQLELQSNSAGSVPLPLSVRFRASDYLSQPHWALALNWNQFPAGPLLELARHMGAQIPPKLQLAGTLDGAMVYSGRGSFQGKLGFHDAAVTIPDSPPVRFEQAYLIMDGGHVRLSPAVVRTTDQDQAEIEADYAVDDDTFDLAISTAGMKVESLRSQVALAAVPWFEQVQSGQWSGQLHYRHQGRKNAWTGNLEVTGAQLAVPQLSDPLHLAEAHVQIDGAKVVLDRVRGQAGKVLFTGEYRYEPGAARPHHVRLRAEEVDAADLETELAPTLRRSSSLLARAFGRATIPDWLQDTAADGTVQIDDLMLAGSHLENVRARLLWDATRLDLDGMQATLDKSAVSARLAINLRGRRPAYKLTGSLKGITWQSGKVDAQGTLQTSGTGLELLTNLVSDGKFTGSNVDFGALTLCRTVSGSFSLTWPQATPQLRLTSLNLRTADEIYTGSGSTQDDGRLVILLTNGSKEMRMSGPLAKVKVE